MIINSEMIIAIIVAVFASSGFWQWLSTKSFKKDERTKALLALLHNEIYTICEQALKKNTIDTDEFDNLACLYEPYKALGGNSTGEVLYEKVKALIEEKGE